MSDDITLDEFTESDGKELSEFVDEGLREEGFLTLPHDWDISTVREVSKEGGLVDGDWIESADMDENGAIQLVQLGHIGEGRFKGKPNRFITKEFAEQEDCTVLSEGDLLISRMQEPILRSCILPSFEQDSVMAVDIARLQEGENWNRMLLKYLFNSRPIWKQGIAWASGTTRKRISRKNIEKLRLPTPPLSEQRKIATVLHTVDQAIQRTEEIIRQFERIHQGLFLNLIPRGIGHDEYDDVRILGRTVQIPSSWEITTVSQACSNIIDYRGKNPEFSEEGIPHLRNINISRGEIILDDIKYVSQETYDEWMTRGIPEKGDTLLSTEAPMGKTAVLPDLKFSLSQRLIVLTPSNQFDSRFFAHLMGSPFVQKEYDARATGSTVKGISNYNLQEVTIPVPPKKEQEQIAQYIDDTLEAIQKNEQQVKRLQHLKQGLMQDLLSGEVRTTDVNMDIPEEVAKYG
jgi:type I restriction enzyme S subunit